MARHTSDSDRRPGWWRVIYPLFLWGCLFLVLSGLRMHERLSARTQISFDPQLQGRSVKGEVTVWVDGKQMGASVGTKVPVSMGKHTLAIHHPKATSMVTNLFVWYGRHDLGVIPLERSRGSLHVMATPPARTITILGPEFSVTLTNSSGQRLSVPTDDYRVSAHYEHWDDTDKVTVGAGETSIKEFAPRLGAVQLESSHPNASFKLYSSKGVVVEQGQLPALVPDLMEGAYRVTASRGKVQGEQSLTIRANHTNRTCVALPFAVVSIVTQPEGASVVDGSGNFWGVTPVERGEIEPGQLKLTLTKDQYAPVNIALRVEGLTTNRLQTNLVSLVFQGAAQQARESLFRGRLEEALAFANKALAENPSESAALSLKREATGRIHLRDGTEAARKEQFTSARSELDLARAQLGDSREVTSLEKEIARLEAARIERTQKEAQRVEQQQVQQRLKELRDAFATASQTYESAAKFQSHELVISNRAAVVGMSITNALASVKPTFYDVALKWMQPELFAITARQRVGGGYRDCLIFGSSVREEEVRVVFKVFEYEHPPDVKLLGGLLQFSSEARVASSDPKLAAQQAERFRQRVAEGVDLVKGRIVKP